MKKQALLSFLLLMVVCSLGTAQDGKQAHKVVCVGFYNFENLFDTLDTEGKRDEDFTPTGKLLYNSKVYQEKLGNLSHVVSQMGTELTPDGPAILGVAEIENKKVLEDFAKQPKVKDRNYQIVHYESLDKRGIDVGLLYNPKYFKVIESGKITPKLFYDKKEDATKRDTVWTRDMLWVKGRLDGDVVYVIVCHWPSRRGGSYLREGAAKYCKDFINGLQNDNPRAKIIVMGDLNDDPVSPSVKDVIKAKEKKGQVKKGGFFNPWAKLYKSGIGTLAYRDSWNLFDQILVSQSILQNNEEGYRFYKNVIFNKSYLISKGGRFKGYPFRTYSFGKYVGGYSDHLPVYIYLVKKIQDKP
ncbi:endonuclease/exonuclease/phosphatase family protein [Aureispira anguillae]|uniref:Endonuclease n=1 Tax=Aureispira anguillae TaxID=2864201 RepID=A0A915YEX5_9BACT|nr:endonuclease [Aureispira anguillae]BDS11873.1 endonuclease [Aureispira anguillae]